MYASVVAISTVTPRPALRFWFPSAVFDWPSALPSAAVVCVLLCVGLLAEVSLPFDPPGLAVPLVGVVLLVSAETVRLCACTGVAAVLSM